MVATTVARPEVDLEWRLAEAQAAEQPLLERVSQLERDLEDALARSDYKIAAKIKNELAAARIEHLIARANVEALRGAVSAITAQRQADTEVIEQQRRRDQARVAATEAQRAEEAAVEDLQQHRAAALAGIEAVRQSVAAGLAAEQRAGEARQSVHNALVELGERQPMRLIAPNDMTVTLERDAVLRAVWSGQP